MNLQKTLISDALSERDFQERVLHYARLNGWLCYHTFDSRKSTPGYPDLTLVRPGELVFAELKTEKGRVSQAQQGWIDLLDTTEAQAYIWKPSDWPVIEEVLRRRRRG